MKNNVLNGKFNDEIKIFESLKNEIGENIKNEKGIYLITKSITKATYSKDYNFDNKILKNSYTIRLIDENKLKIGSEIESNIFGKMKLVKKQNIYNLKGEYIYTFGLCIQQ